MKKYAFLLCCLSFAACGLPAMGDKIVEQNMRTQYERVSLVKLADGLEHPWAVAFLGENRFLISERGGRLFLFDEKGGRHEVSGLPEDLYARGQGGLLDVVAHPNYEENGWVYMTYAKGDRQGTATTLLRARLEDNQLVETEKLFTQDRTSSPGRHYGSRTLFTESSTLLMTIGDRGTEPPRAQDTLDHAGSVLRLHDDGSIPDDNPFVGNDDYHPEIYSYGHRNIQGIALHPESGEVWVTDHGPRGGDRLDRIDAGANYGWPAVTPGRDYRTEEPFEEQRVGFGKIPPVHEFLPTLAPSGLAFADAETFPNWENNLLAGGLRGQQIQRLVVEYGPLQKFEAGQRRITIEGPYLAHAEHLLLERIGRIRDVRTGPEGNLYILTDQSDGALYRLQPAK